MYPNMECFADLFAGGLLATCLSRDIRPCVRSISWSPLGLAPNAGYETRVSSILLFFYWLMQLIDSNSQTWYLPFYPPTPWPLEPGLKGYYFIVFSLPFGYCCIKASIIVWMAMACYDFNCNWVFTWCRCLLAICTIEGRVKLYRAPFCEFQVEWIEVHVTGGLIEAPYMGPQMDHFVTKGML